MSAYRQPILALILHVFAVLLFVIASPGLCAEREGELQVFTAHRKISIGWLAYACERTPYPPNKEVYSPKEWEDGSQLVLVRFYGAPVAEGERIVTRVVRGRPEELEVGGELRVLRTFDVVGADRQEN